MGSALLFERINNNQQELSISFTFDGETINARKGETVAIALLASGCEWVRKTPSLSQKRNPFCMMGSCYDCLVSINNCHVQACMVECEQGLVVSRISEINYDKNP
jgi:predicted molibdopterin-dependent oxidoreductase YjgC